MEYKIFKETTDFSLEKNNQNASLEFQVKKEGVVSVGLLFIRPSFILGVNEDTLARDVAMINVLDKYFNNSDAAVKLQNFHLSLETFINGQWIKSGNAYKAVAKKYFSTNQYDYFELKSFNLAKGQYRVTLVNGRGYEDFSSFQVKLCAAQIPPRKY